MQFNCKVIKCANPTICTPTPLFQSYPPFLAKFLVLPPSERGGGGWSNYASTKETLLGNLIDLELSFDQRISSICSKASKKLHALGCIATFMSFKKRRTLMKAFIESQFNYCPLMFHSRTINNKIAFMKERCG